MHTHRELRSKKLISEPYEEYGSTLHQTTHKAINRPKGSAIRKILSNTVFDLDRLTQRDSDLNSLKFYLNYHYNANLSDNDASFYPQQTAMDTSLTNHSQNRSITESKIKKEYKNEGKERLLTPRGTRLTPINLEADKTEKSKDHVNFKITTGDRFFPNKRTLAKKIASVELQNSNGDVTGLNSSKISEENALKIRQVSFENS